MALLEREPMLSRLSALVRESQRGVGRLVLLRGEAGIGKTALIDSFSERHSSTLRLLRGACDAVRPARPFAPLEDIAQTAGGRLRPALEAGDRDRVFSAFLDLLREPAPKSTVLVLEDLHWADEATLDLLRIVGRRLPELDVLVLGTYRDDEVEPDHPLRLALGDLPAGVIVEISLSPLSVAAVQQIVGRRPIDAVALHRATAGNPFFITEVLSAASSEIPATVRDAVHARLARLSEGAKRVVWAASVLGERCDTAVLEQVAQTEPEALEECLARGVLLAEAGNVQFRHEIAQRAVLDSLPGSRRVALHGRALAVLRERPTASDPGRLAHHAIESGDRDAVLEHARTAAKRAAALGAHRQAAALYGACLRFADALDDRARAELFQGHASASLLSDEVERALHSQGQALECWRRLGDVRREGDCLRVLATMLWTAGQSRQAIEVASRAVELLESVSPPGRELCRAYAVLAQRLAVSGRHDDAAVTIARRALDLAERLGYEAVVVHALTSIGLVEAYQGQQAGLDKLEESARRARAAGVDEGLGRALINLIEVGRDLRRFELCDRYGAETLAVLEHHDLHIYRRRVTCALAEVDSARGRWREAAEVAEYLLAEPRTASIIRVRALTLLGRVRARRGEHDAWALLDAALDLCGTQGEAQELCPLRSARAEAAWLEGNAALAAEEAANGLAVALSDVADSWWRSELRFWAWKAGVLDHLPDGTAEPYRLHAGGRVQDAADAWAQIGARYEQAAALADSDREDDLRRALEILNSLGARPLARRVTLRLQAMGARGIARGPRPRTGANPAHLTAREMEVLALLGKGLRNADIADKLVVSTKTVDHHVSAVLRKLGVADRAAAGREARRLGIHLPPGVEDGELAAPR